MKSLLLSALLIASAPAYAVLTEGDILSAASCNSIADNNYFVREFTTKFGVPVRNEQGALWFTASGSVYNTSMKEVFVSSNPSIHFVGIVFESKPDEVVKSIPTSNRYPTNVFPSNKHWVGADGRVIMWHDGKYTKMFCTQK